MELLGDLCQLAGMSEEWEAADDESVEGVAREAAELLDVEI